MSNPLDSQKTKLLMTKKADFSIFSLGLDQFFSKKAKITIQLLLKNPKKIAKKKI